MPAANDEISRQERHERAKRSLEKAYTTLPLVARPAVTTIQDAKLPRTTTRKVKRKELARLLERLDVAATQRSQELSHTDNVEATVRSAIGSISRRQPSQIQPSMTLRGMPAGRHLPVGSSTPRRLNASSTFCAAQSW